MDSLLSRRGFIQRAALATTGLVFTDMSRFAEAIGPLVDGPLGRYDADCGAR